MIIDGLKVDNSTTTENICELISIYHEHYSCSDTYNCCDCGGNNCGCRGCFSCNACEVCLNE